MRTLVALSFVVALASAASGAVIVQADFESYTSQAQFESAWPPVTAGLSGAWSTAQASSPTHSVFYAKTPATNNNYKTFAETSGSDAQPLEWSFKFYDSVIYANRNYAQLMDYAPTTNQNLQMGVYNTAPGQSNTYYSARVAFMPGGGTAPGWFLLNDPGASTRSVGWHELKAVIKSTTIDYYVDGLLSKAGVAYLSGTATVSFEQMRLNGGVTSTNDAYIDDVLLQTTPEPAGLALLALGLLLRRR